MALASGFNAVLNKATPCLVDLTNLSMALISAILVPLKTPMRYARPWIASSANAVAAREIAVGFLDGKYLGGDGRRYGGSVSQIRPTSQERQKQLVYFGSKFFQEVFYKTRTGCD